MVGQTPPTLLPATLHGLPGALPMVPAVVVIRVYQPPYYPPYYYLPPPPPPLPYDPLALAMLAVELAVWPQYYSLMLEMYRAVIEAWRKTLEQLYAQPAGAGKNA